jgi:hypothetical protein
MPSESSLAQALEQFRGCWEPWHEAVLYTAEELDVMLQATRSTPSDQPSALSTALGPLGAAHLDVSRLAPVLSTRGSGDERLVALLESAVGTLRLMLQAGPTPVIVPDGGNLVETVRNELAWLGRVFGVAHAVQHAKAGGYDPLRQGDWFHQYPFTSWTRSERKLAPALVVSVSGADLQPAGLAEFLDGSVKLALVTRGATAPLAPLVRLITPNVYVAQTHDGAQLAALAQRDGPGVVAWLPETSAAFVHDPAAGDTLATRLHVIAVPTAPRHGVGAMSAFQLAEERAQLEALIRHALIESVAASPVASSDPVDKLAAWILHHGEAAGASS